MGTGKEFAGKVVLVTGGSRGIGKAIALHFARRGADIAFNYLRSHTSANEAQQEIEALGARCVKERAHLGDAEKIRGLFETVEAEYGRLDVLVNNAASGVNVAAAELGEKHWNWTMDINAKAAWLCSIEASRLMPDGGHIVNITSEGSRNVLPNYFAVGTSKAALGGDHAVPGRRTGTEEHLGERRFGRICRYGRAQRFQGQGADARRRGEDRDGQDGHG